jgi:dolichyl-phosphate beta-glucosyltransferase
MITVSFIIPVANEEKRLEKTFTALQTVRVPHGIRLTEVIFVNDGSTDFTASMINEFGKHNKRVRLISYTQNQGKGYAVRQGMLAATGDYALFFDADMSTSLSQIKKFVPYMKNHRDVIIGTRKNGKSTVISRQPWSRELIGKCFTKLTQFLLQVDVTDFTCGFKAFSQRARLTIFPRSIINGWGFDAEILLLAKIMGFTIAEKAVAWTNDENTKVNLAKAIPQTLQELIRIHWIHIVKRYYFRPSKFPLSFDEVRQYQFGEFSPHLNPLPEEREKYHLLGGEQVEEFVFSIGVGDDRTEKVSVLSLEGKLAK